MIFVQLRQLPADAAAILGLTHYLPLTPFTTLPALLSLPCAAADDLTRELSDGRIHHQEDLSPSYLKWWSRCTRVSGVE